MSKLGWQQVLLKERGANHDFQDLTEHGRRHLSHDSPLHVSPAKIKVGRVGQAPFGLVVRAGENNGIPTKVHNCLRGNERIAWELLLSTITEVLVEFFQAQFPFVLQLLGRHCIKKE